MSSYIDKKERYGKRFMDKTFAPLTSRIARINSPEYIQKKLFLTYDGLIILCFFAGMIIERSAGKLFPEMMISGIKNSYFPVVSPGIVNFISSIIYNSVDIFKISFIIMIAGFTYISGMICKFCAACYAVYTGFSFFCVFDILRSKYDGIVLTLFICLITVTFLLYFAVIGLDCAYAEISAYKFSEYRNPRVLMTSEAFWNYIGRFFISFGYFLMIRGFYEFIILFLM